MLVIRSLTADCDVIFFPDQYAAFCYSLELIYNYELIKKPKNTTNFWVGVGCVGSFFYIDRPTYGIELAYEKRHYFKSENYKHFSICGYIGLAYMTEFKYAHDIGLIPGFKVTYKAQIAQNIILEPYISLSVPIVYDVKESVGFFPIPVATIGVRFGLSKLKNRSI